MALSQKDVHLDLGLLKSLNKKDLEDALKYLTENLEKIFKSNIEEVYRINTSILKGNYVPLEEMLSAVTVVYDMNPPSCKIYIDEDKITWKDSKGESVHSIPLNKQYYDGFVTKEVKTLNEYWMLPISSIQEESWIIDRTYKGIVEFIQKEFIQYIFNKLRRK